MALLAPEGPAATDPTRTEDGTAREGARPRERPVLVLVDTPDHERAGERCTLPPRALVPIGRRSATFPGGPLADSRMSSHHVTVRLVRGQHLEVRDAGSKNGLIVDGERVAAAVLRPGQLLQLGRTFLQLRVEPPLALPRGPTRLVGISRAMVELRARVRAAAAHRQPVLIVGPSGVGKEPTAREIHHHSGRRGRFVSVNCGALPRDLAESELFGHVAGAFSGATGARVGLIEAASGGTLLLDEIATMPLDLQVKLLRVLQEGVVRPVGGGRERPVDVRVIGATNRDLVELVHDGRFREDLYGRLYGALLRPPALRERPEDIPALARYLLARGGYEGVVPAADLLWALVRHPWPLNVRGLEQLLLAAAHADPGPRLRLRPVVAELLAEQERLVVGDSEPTTAPRTAPRGAPPTEVLDDLLTEHRGVVSRVAAALGVHRYQVYRWARGAGLDVDAYR